MKKAKTYVVDLDSIIYMEAPTPEFESASSVTFANAWTPYAMCPNQPKMATMAICLALKGGFSCR